MFTICVYVPESHAEAVKEAMFAAGAGRIGNYEACSWQVTGVGQFRPLAGSQPFLGQQGVVEQVAECRIEMVCEAACIDTAIAALKQAHPYETPAYHVIRVEAL